MIVRLLVLAVILLRNQTSCDMTCQLVNSSLFQKILLPPPVGSKQANPFFLDYLNSEEEGSKLLQNISINLPVDTS